MKKSDCGFSLYAVITLFVICNILFTWCYFNQKKYQNLLYAKLENQHKKEYEAAINQMESGHIMRYISPQDTVLAGKFVIAFPNNVCDVCNKWLFSEISKLKENCRLAAVIPRKMKKVIETYNSIYNLRLYPIYYTERYILPDNNLKDEIYLFYCSKAGQILYPLVLRKGIVDIHFYMSLVKMIDSDFQ